MTKLTYLDSLPPRILGIETEYGVLAAGQDGRRVVDADTVGRELFAPIHQRYQASSVFLENGGRLYLDVGSHPEYATAECLDLQDILAQDRAGAEILQDMAVSASQRLTDQTGIPTQVHLLKNNLDSAGNSCGCHENYLLYRTSQFRALADALVTFLVTRQIFLGAGALLRIQGETKFCLSQRAFQIDDTVSAATTTTRPLVNTRDEPHGDAKLYRRLHVIVGDSNVLESPTRAKIAMMNLLLGALEAGGDFSDIALNNPIGALQEITQNLPHQGKPLELVSGKQFTALELQAEFCSRLSRIYSEATLPAGYREVLHEWQAWIKALAAGDYLALNGVLDWPTKLTLLEKLRSRQGLTWGDSKLARLDLAYHDLVAGLNLESRGLAQRLTATHEVETAKTTPPQNTRATLRGQFIRCAQDHNLQFQADWTKLRLRGKAGGDITLSNPFVTESESVAKLLRTMETL
ncbi:proteasome accessory factor PafA2 family protein [Mobiluncus mulieris]|uniref:proteasome accessory factor PafA2 family protein n=1 Tax=Mobiluncus mulieris TaxID=2052 RepID=UPI00242F87BE|nr:proteasome accessory factor PafA2 family protein [Mobiluncus mulieris]